MLYPLSYEGLVPPYQCHRRAPQRGAADLARTRQARLVG